MFVDDLLQRAFGGAVDKLVLRALESKQVPAEEMNQIRELLKRIEGDEK